MAIIPTQKQVKPVAQDVPSEETLRQMVQFNLIDQCRDLININKLPFRLVQKDDKWELEDAIEGTDLWLKKFITADSETLVMKSEARKLAGCEYEVLILGETGTGKEIIARSLIGNRTGAFKRINCAAMPKELIESELFGHVKGAFTGADTPKKGLMESATNGVLFLDEVGDLPLETQAKILNALQPVDGKRYIRRVGSNDEVEINCRIVCATHRNLEEMVRNNQFRIDLYARISTFVLKIKPLRERTEDIPLIVKEIGFILKQEAKAMEFLENHFQAMLDAKLSLTFNVRSLEQYIKRYSVLGHP